MRQLVLLARCVRSIYSYSLKQGAELLPVSSPTTKSSPARLGKTILGYLAAHIFRGALGLTALRAEPKQQRYFLAAAIRVKDEGRFLPELLAHHRLLGFEHFYIYDNNSSDNPADILKPFVDADLVTIIPWPDVPASPSCYTHLFKHYAGECKWIAFIDADEFVSEKSPGLLLDTLRSRSQSPALALNWLYFGSSSHESLPTGLVLDNFTMSDSIADSHVKVILQPLFVTHYFTDHNYVFKYGRFARDVLGNAVLGSRSSYARHATDLLINHYVYRSKENYLSKTRRGFATERGAKQQARRVERAETEFVRHNDVQNFHSRDLYAPRVRALLSDLGYGAPYVGP